MNILAPATSQRLATPGLSPEARDLIKLSMRANTRRAYKTQLRQWEAWCAEKGECACPASPVAVANYLAERGSAGQSVSTLRTVVSAIRAGHDAANVDRPLHEQLHFDTLDPHIVRTLRGLANEQPRLPKQAEPIRAAEILELLQAADDAPISRRDAALFALGYMFALRRSELVALDLDKLGDGQGVLRITAKTLEVTFARTKTSSGKPQSVAVPRAENTEAVKAIEAWISLAGVKTGEPLLRRVTKGGTIGGRLHPQSVAKIVKARIAEQYERQTPPLSPAKARAEAARYSGHSLRVGFAVTAAEEGADIRSIATVTRHRSMAMPARYAEKADQVRTSPHRLPGVGLKSEAS